VTLFDFEPHDPTRRYRRRNTEVHKHYCGVTGHEYECSNEDCVCICDLPMEGHNHSNCPIELRDCPEHPADQERPMAEVESDAVEIDFTSLSQQRQAARPHCNCGCADLAPGTAVGFCLWCDHVYVEYSPASESRHFVHHCSGAPEQLKESARAKLASRCTGK